MKKILTVVLLWTALYGTAFSQNASDFTVDAKGVITKYIGFDAVIVIPEVIGGKKITAIGNEAFLRADLTKVTIPEGVTTIGESAFNGNKLTSITIPNSVTDIGKSAFANNRLTSVTIPGSVKTIGDNTFYNNTTLAKIVISEGVINIGNGAFANTKCTSVSLPSTITFIGADAFDESAKPSFTLAANIPEFYFVPAFYSYIANDRKAGTYAFNLPLVDKKADDYEYCETRYGAVLIRYTGDSNRVRIPATIGGVAVKALFGRWSGNSFIGTFQGKKLVAVQIPEGITYIGFNTFRGNELTNVTIPNSITYLSGFSNNLLTSVTIPNGVIRIGNSAFFECESLTSVTIPNNVTSIGSYAFAKCKSLTSVTFEGTITSDNLDKNAFDQFSYLSYNYSYTGDLREKYLAGGIGTYTKSGWYEDWKKTQSISQPAAPSQTTTQQPNAAATSAVSAAGTPGLKYDYLPNSDNKQLIVSAGTARGAVVIPATYNNLPVTVINEEGFKSDGITDITIPNSVLVIGHKAFQGCTELTSVIIPKSVIIIGSAAFDCSNLTSVTFEGTIRSNRLGLDTISPFPGDLRAKYLKGGIGTYTRPDGKSKTWTKQ